MAAKIGVDMGGAFTDVIDVGAHGFKIARCCRRRTIRRAPCALPYANSARR